MNHLHNNILIVTSQNPDASFLSDNMEILSLSDPEPSFQPVGICLKTLEYATLPFYDHIKANSRPIDLSCSIKNRWVEGEGDQL